MKSEKAEQLLSGLTEEKGLDFYALSEDRHPDFLMLELDKIRRWLRMPTSGAPRPQPDFLAVLLAYGREACLKIWRAYCEETQRTVEEETETLRALALLVRHARSLRLISWSIDDIRPEAAKGRSRLLVELSPDVDERLRSAAASRGESLRQFTEEAIRSRLAQVERPRRAASRDETAGEVTAASAR